MTLDKFLTDGKISNADFARSVGLNRSQVGRLRKGSSKPTWATVKRIEEVTKRKVKASDWSLAMEAAA